MRREYDFSHGTRGKHVGKRVHIVGDKQSGNGPNTAAKIQQIIERDLKSRADFNVVWSELDRAERESIRTAWLKKISAVLEDQPALPSRKPNNSSGTLQSKLSAKTQRAPRETD